MKELILDKTLKENNQLEFKKAKGGLPLSFFETYSAFSNTKGGIVYLGIIEDKENKIIKSAELTLEDIESLKINLFSSLNNKQKVSYNSIKDEDIEVLEFEGFPVLKIKIDVAPLEYRPIYINNNVNNGTYRRNNEGDYHCSLLEIKSMMSDSLLRSGDSEIVEELNVDDLCKDTINSYINALKNYRPDNIFLAEKDINKFLTLIGALKLGKDSIYHPTKAGLLMFGYSYKITYIFPSFFLDYQEHYDNGENRYTDRLYSDSGTWSGNVFDFFIKASAKLTCDLKTPFKLEGIYRVDDTSMHKAVREALVNTLVNADYSLTLGVVIKKYIDKIVFSNPGTLRISKEQAFNGGISDARNKTILKMFNLVGIGERMGSGIPKILFAAKEFNYKEPTLEESFSPDNIILTVYLNNKVCSINNKEEMIVNYLKENGDTKVKDLATFSNESISTIKRQLYSLMDKGIVEAKGTIKDKKYFLK